MYFQPADKSLISSRIGDILCILKFWVLIDDLILLISSFDEVKGICSEDAIEFGVDFGIDFFIEVFLEDL